jgi:hypothetical protein
VAIGRGASVGDEDMVVGEADATCVGGDVAVGDMMVSVGGRGVEESGGASMAAVAGARVMGAGVAVVAHAAINNVVARSAIAVCIHRTMLVLITDLPFKAGPSWWSAA